MQYSIRSFVTGDLPAMKEITCEAFEGVSLARNMERQFGHINGHDWRWRKCRHLDDDAARAGAANFVAVSGQRVVGYITTWLDRDAGVGYIPNLAVEQSARGHGLGRQLIQHALDNFRQQGLTHARIETLEQNPIGQQLYPSLGFEEIGRQIHFGAKL